MGHLGGVRAAVRAAIGSASLRQAAELAGVSEGTLRRIMRGADVRVGTVVRILEAHGHVLVMGVRKRQDIAAPSSTPPAQ
jgi:hypothetical protein